MERKLIKYAIADSFYEEKKNLLNTYYPFVLKSFDKKETSTPKAISDTIKSVFDIDLPL
jgi:hypothetical protein